MKAVIQRVNFASVEVNNQIISEIKQGLLVLIGIKQADTQKEADVIIDKILNLRIFEDNQEKMNHSVIDIKGEVLLVSQFTLYGNCSKGRRPSFELAAKPDEALRLYEYIIEKATAKYPKIKTGQFGADMKILLENDGPVTLIVEK
jgi:D-aminoacyl-tRNA deacylase